MSIRRGVAGALFAVLIAGGSLAVSVDGRAEGKSPSKKSDEASTSKGVALSADYVKACEQGAGKYASRDFAGAIEQFRKAIELNPKQPLGYYLLGEAQLAAGSLTEAEAAWNRALLESGEQDPSMRARILFVVADLKERQKKWDEARAAWQAYLDWAGKYPNAGAFPASGQSRQQVIDNMTKQDKAYDVVRQRIADTKNGGVFTDLSKSPPAGK
jgi:tetratricopeptide (TPR) repeat protein